MKGDMLYRKQGRRYYPVGPEFTGWPADGVWLVEKDGTHSRLYTQLGELPDAMSAAAIELHRDTICRVLMELRAQTVMMMADGEQAGLNINMIATAIIREIMREESCRTKS